ncbi:MAG: hypothetical protein CSA11_11240 [Chloroflexi bacterium]|nr:MAG: hypothetical protein CSB13_03050 [Chloroflexota bacterium]PIE79681.1 MAG: hypothetical protein CSA11_11240 [Chloroflexota bacterium]
MAALVTNNATIQCSFGTTPGQLLIAPENLTNGCSMPAATIMDNVPMKNVLPCGMCTTLTNPQVAAATAAAQGVLTPQPCIPVTTAPWTPGSPTVTIGMKPALNNSCALTCAWGGVISIQNAGQQTVNVP